jgi:uncharacterized membrane protein YozB (DUF420 family)
LKAWLFFVAIFCLWKRKIEKRNRKIEAYAILLSFCLLVAKEKIVPKKGKVKRAYFWLLAVFFTLVDLGGACCLLEVWDVGSTSIVPCCWL